MSGGGYGGCNGTNGGGGHAGGSGAAGPYATAGAPGYSSPYQGGGGGGGSAGGGRGGDGGDSGASGGAGGTRTHKNGYAGGNGSGRQGAGGGGGGYNGYVGSGTNLIIIAIGGNGGAGGAAGTGGGGGGGGGYGAVLSGKQIENQTQVTGGIGGVGGTSEASYDGTGYDVTIGSSGSGGAGLYVVNAGAKVTQDLSGSATGGAGGAGAAYSFDHKGGAGAGGTGILFKGAYSAALSNTGFVSGGSGGAAGYTGYGGAGGDGIVNRQADSVYNAGSAQGGAGGRGLYAGNGGAGVYFAGRFAGQFVKVAVTNSSNGTIAGGAAGSYTVSDSGGVIRVGANGGDGVLFGRYSSGNLTNAGLIEGGAANAFLATGGAGVSVTTAPVTLYTYYAGGRSVTTYTTSTTITNNSAGTIRGGYGNYGGAGVSFASTGLRGSLVNAGAVIGGSATYPNVGGAGVVGENLTIIDTGQISGTAGADAIIFTGGENTLAFGTNAGLVGGSALTGAIDIESGYLLFNQSAGAADGAPASVVVADTIIGGGEVIQAGNGVLKLAGDNSFSGQVVLQSGVLSVSADDNLGASSGAVFFGGGTLQTTGSFATARPITLEGNGIFDVETVNTSLSGTIAGGYALMKLGSGTLTLSGDNSYSGGTAIDAGVLSVLADNNLGAASGSLTFAGGTLQTTASLASARNISLTTNGTFDVEGGPVLLSGVISGTGGLVTNGGGTLTLVNTESYTGQTTISAGTLQLGNGGADGSLSGPILDNAVLALDPHNAQSFANRISGNVGTLSKIGTGTAVLTGASSFSGHTTITEGTLQFGDGTTNGSVQGPIADNALLALDPNGVQTYRQISGTGSLSKIGAGTAILTGTDTYTGRTTISAGTLQLGNGVEDGSVSGQIADNAVLSLDPTGSQSFANPISGSGMLIVQAGTVDLTAADTYGGGTEIDAGATLEIGKGDRAGNASGGSATIAFEGAHADLLVEAGASYDAVNQTISTDDGRHYAVSLPAGTTLDATQESGGATLFTDQTLCFGKGTHIRVVRDGQITDIAVTSLRVGDIAVTATGGHVPVRWIGHRALDENLLAAHPESGPVRILPGAFGENLPARTLSLSPGHPVLVGADPDGEGGVLVPIMCLINGTSVAWERVKSVEYWHVELERHDILLAEGLPAESFLDYGNRGWFENGAAHALTNPDFIPPGLEGRCRPVAVDGKLVEAERRRIDTRFALDLESQCRWPTSDMDMTRYFA